MTQQKGMNDSVLRIQIVVQRITPILLFLYKKKSISANEKKVKWYNITVRAFSEQCKKNCE